MEFWSSPYTPNPDFVGLWVFVMTARLGVYRSVGELTWSFFCRMACAKHTLHGMGAFEYNCGEFHLMGIQCMKGCLHFERVVFPLALLRGLFNSLSCLAPQFSRGLP